MPATTTPPTPTAPPPPVAKAALEAGQGLQILGGLLVDSAPKLPPNVIQQMTDLLSQIQAASDKIQIMISPPAADAGGSAAFSRDAGGRARKDRLLSLSAHGRAALIERGVDARRLRQSGGM
jgi:hypothetical protein